MTFLVPQERLNPNGRRWSIERALERRVALLPWDPAQIAWANREFRPVSGTAYLRPRVSSANRVQLGLGPDGYAQWRGTYTIGVLTPRDSGTEQQARTADDLLMLFPRATRILLEDAGTMCIEYSSAPAAVPSGDWSELPVVVTWFSNDTSGVSND